MRCRSVSAVAILCLVPLFFCFARPGKSGSEQKSSAAEAGRMAIGLCEDYPEELTTIDKIRNDLEVLKRANIRVLRIAFGWDGIEPEKGKFAWLFWDDLVKMAVDEYGIRLIPYVCYTPRWNSTGDSTNYWNHPPKDYEEFGVFMSALVNRYKDRISSWEIWNEADISVFWSGDAAELAKLVKIGSAAVRRADAKATVVLGGLAWNTNFTLQLFRDYGISPYVDVVNMHSYFETWHGSPLETLPSYVNTVAGIVRRYGNGQALWMAETGYSNFRRGAYVSTSYTAYYDYEHTAQFQAVDLVRTLTLALSTGKLSLAAWYRVNDLPTTQNVIGDVNNCFLGVDGLGGKPKPAEAAIAFFNRLFAAHVTCIDDQVEVTRTIGSATEVHVFHKEDGGAIVVAWLKTDVPGMRGDDTTGTAKDTRKEVIGLRLPFALKGSAVQADELGETRPFPHTVVEGNATAVRDLELVGGKVAIVEIPR